MNTLAIADAIAARFVGLTANGEALVAPPTARLPGTIANGPVILVFPPTGSLEVGVSARRDDLYTFPVRLLRDPVSYPERYIAIYAWYDAMHDLIGGQMQLGLSYVSIAEPVAVSLEIDSKAYYAGTYDVVELTVEVRVNEHVTVAV